MNKRMLITGGLGFLGSYALEQYLGKYDITIIDNLSTNVLLPDSPLAQKTNLIVSDVLDYKWSKKDPFDVVLHLASPVGPVGILKHSGKMARIIIDDMYWCIEGAMLHNAPLVFISTSEIYGYRAQMECLKEDDYKILVGDYKVRNEYAISKLLGEIVLSNTAKVSDIHYHIIRPFNISGARQLKNGGFVMPTFVLQALNGDPITVYGDGTQIRSFTHAADIISGVDMILFRGVPNEIWNVGDPANRMTILELAERIKHATNSSSEIVFVDPKTIHGPLYEEAWDKVPDSTKISTQLGWNTTWKVEDIISDVIEYYKT